MTSLSEDYLTGPAPNPSRRTIDFGNSSLPENAGMYAVVLDGVLSSKECHELVEAAKAHASWERALVNVGGGMQMLSEGTRKCERIIWDDQEIMDRLWARVEPFVPELQHFDVPLKKHITRDNLDLTKLNNRMRILKYGQGEYFKRKSK